MPSNFVVPYLANVVVAGTDGGLAAPSLNIVVAIEVSAVLIGHATTGD